MAAPKRQFWGSPAGTTLGVFAISLVFGVVMGGLLLLQQVQDAAMTGKPIPNLAMSIQTQAVRWGIWALIVPAMLWTGRIFRLEPPRLWPKVAAQLLLLLAFTLAYSMIWAQYTLSWMMRNPNNYRYSFKDWLLYVLPVQLAWGIFIHCTVVGVDYAVHYSRRWREETVARAQLGQQLVEARLQALSRQLQPHFLFNTLHTIAGLVRTEQNNTAVTMIAGLSDLLRLTLQHEGTQETTLREELELLELYLRIQRVRFSDRLRLSIDTPPEVLGAMVPSLILQPLVENAFEHGIARRAEAGRLELRFWRESDRLEISVRNDGAPLPADWSLERNGGVGLRNSSARLEQLYGERSSLRVANDTDGQVLVRISMPWRAEAVNLSGQAHEAAFSRAAS